MSLSYRRCSGHPIMSMLAIGLVCVGASAQVPSTSLIVSPAISGMSTRVVAFIDVSVIPMDAERVLPNQTVLVDRGRIIALGPASQIKVPREVLRVEARGHYLIPGLADMHAHLMGGMRADGIIGTPEARLFHWLAYGVTTIRNLDHQEGGKTAIRMLQLRKQAARGELWSPRIYTSGSLGLSRQHKSAASRPELAAEYVARYQAAGYDHIKPYLELPEMFDSVAAAARRLGIPLMGHVPDGVSLDRALASGAYRSIEHLTGYYGESEQALPEMGNQDPTSFPALAAATKKAGVWNTPTMAVIERAFALSRRLRHEQSEPNAQRDSTDALHVRALANFRTLVKVLQDAGAGLLLGVDAAVDHPEIYLQRGPGIHEELAALVRAGLTPYQALLTGTRNVAEFYGALAESGTIAAGKRADLVLLRDNPLGDIRHTKQIAGVMLGGRWLSRAELDRRLQEIRLPAMASP